MAEPKERRGGSERSREALSALGFDPSAVLLRDPAVVADPRFLGALHLELEEEFGRDEAARILVQIGFLHGLQEATRVVAARSGGGEAGWPSSPPLALRFRTTPCDAPPGAVEVRGTWPERCEAEARLRTEGGNGEPCCHLSAGFTSGWLSGMLDADLLALEVQCSAAGAPRCEFVAREAEAWQTEGDARANALLDALPFAAFREFVDREGVAAEDGAGQETKPDAFDPEAAVIHIWGPVMVIPYSSTEEALQAVELIGRDPGAREVSVVVIDLTGATLDDAFGALSLGRIVDAIEGWGAESVLAGVTPGAERILADLERPPLLVHRDLSRAIAVGFQIAESQRRAT